MDSIRRESVKSVRFDNRNPRRLIHQGELCEGKFVAALHCHPTIPGTCT